MKALVTGSAGFLGRHFTRALEQRGWEVRTCDTKTGGDALWVFGGYDQIHETVFDLVVHCAAVEPHRAAIDGMPNHLAANLHLDAALFDWAVRTGQRRVLYLSSSAAYPVWLQDGRGYRLTERDTAKAIQPDAGYGWTKLTGERMAADAIGAGLAVHVVRPFSGYGEDQDTRWPFGAFIDRARRRDDPFIVWGPGTQVRDWIHVDDVVDGALAVVDADFLLPVNLCTGVGTSMLDLAELVCKTAGYRPAIQNQPDAPTGVFYRVGNPTRLHTIYTPKIDIAEGVRRAFDRDLHQ